MKKKVALWTDCLPENVDADNVCAFLSSFGFDARRAGELFGTSELLLASIRIRDIETPLDAPSADSFADSACPMYDGLWFQREAHRRLSGMGEQGTANLVCTGRLICTYEGRRYHARTVIMGGAPSVQIVSSEGAVEGPAKPPEYYWAKARIVEQGAGSLSVLDEVFEDRFIKGSDSILGQVVSAYCLQPLMYFFRGREFCSDPGCSLFNSHMQSEVMKAQAMGLLCAECRAVLESNSPSV